MEEEREDHMITYWDLSLFISGTIIRFNAPVREMHCLRELELVKSEQPAIIVAEQQWCYCDENLPKRKRFRNEEVEEDIHQ